MPSKSGLPGWRAVVGVSLLAVTLRLLVFGYIMHDPVKFYLPDSHGYERRALNLLQHGVFSSRAEAPFTPDLVRTPGYPALMAGVFGVAGHRPAAVIGLQILLGAGMAGGTLWLACLLGLSPGAALAAGAIVAVDPVSSMTANVLLTETLFSALLLAGMTLLARHWDTARARWLVGSAAALGLASLTRPIGQFLPLALVPLFGMATRPPRLRPVVRLGVPFAILATALPAAWAVRNYRETGVLTLSSAASGVLVAYWARAVVADAEGISQDAARERLAGRFQQATAGRGLTRSEAMALRREQATAVLLEHPGRALAIMAKGAGRLLTDPGYTLACTVLDRGSHATECFPGRATMNEPGLLQRAVARFLEMSAIQRLALSASALLLGATYIGAVAGTIALAREGRWLPVVLTGTVIVYLVALSAGAQAESRFRIPILPFLAVLAGAGWARSRETLAGASRHRPGPPTAH